MGYDGRYKLIDNKNGPQILHDLQSDPSETINFAHEKVSVVEKLEILLPPWFPMIKDNITNSGKSGSHPGKVSKP